MIVFYAQARKRALQRDAVEPIFRSAPVAPYHLLGALRSLPRALLVDLFGPFHRLRKDDGFVGRTSIKPSLINASRVFPSAVIFKIPGSVARTVGWCIAMIVHSPPTALTVIDSTRPL